MTALLRRPLLAALVLAAVVLPCDAQAQAPPSPSQKPSSAAPGARPASPMTMDADTVGPSAGEMMLGAPMSVRMGEMTHIEGRLAFLKTEIMITQAQDRLWEAFAEAVRTNVKLMYQTHQSMQEATRSSLPQRLEARERALNAYLDGVRRIRAAVTPLYAALSAEQKKLADEIIVGPMGMPMGMM